MQKEQVNQWIDDFYQYIAEFRYYSYRASHLPWIYRTILYLPVGAAIEWYWIRKMSKCNKDYRDKYLKDHE